MVRLPAPGRQAHGAALQGLHLQGPLPHAPDAEHGGPDAGRAAGSVLTALSLSLNNLLTKKGRTILTAFAGSIGIIGIALILSLSSGVNAYIARVQEDTLSSYPLEIDERTIDMTDMMNGMMDISSDSREHEEGKVYSGRGISTDIIGSGIRAYVNALNKIVYEEQN